ncbi:MAG: hypothetical protein H7317_08040 [Pseudorhodobacter sp.]|nr:hypothetical protein [Pseudorhodobacter sp.]
MRLVLPVFTREDGIEAAKHAFIPMLTGQNFGKHLVKVGLLFRGMPTSCLWPADLARCLNDCAG